MAIRLYSEFVSDQGTQYKIELHDSAWLGASYEFECGGDGFRLTYTGQTDDIISPIIGSECEVGVAIRTGQILNFFDALKTYQENRFRVVIYTNDSYTIAQEFRQRVIDDSGTFEGFECVQDAVQALGGDDYRLFWAGWVMQDLITLEDASEPYFMRLKAVDGIGRLANIDYTDANDITQNGLGITRSNIILFNCLKSIGTVDLWGASDAFLETCVDWWETSNMVYATTDDPLYLSGVDVGLFESKDDDGNTIRLTYFDVLRQLAVLWNARVYITEGRFIFEQVGARASASRYISQYSKAGVVIANPSVSDDITIDQTSGNARLAGNTWDFLPAVKKVSVIYAQRFLSPWFGAGAFNTGNTTQTVGFVAGGQGIQLAFYGPFNYVLNTSNPAIITNDIDELSPLFRAEIRVEDSSNTGTYHYFTRDFLGYAQPKTFSAPQWGTTQGYYYFDIGVDEVRGGSASIYNNVTILTQDLPVTGTMRFILDYWKSVNMRNDANYTLDGIQSETWNAVIAFSRVDNGQEPASGEVYTSINGSTTIGSNLTLDLGELYIGDGSLQSGDLLSYSSSSLEWEASSAWRKGNSGSGLPILKLMTNEALALHAVPIQRYNGKILSNPSFQPRLLFDGSYYLRTGGTFTANYDEWDATMFPIARDTSNISDVAPIYLDRSPSGKASSSAGAGNTPNDINIGKVGGMQLDAQNQKLGPFQEITDGGRVVGIFNTTGNATLDQKLLVDGGTILGLGSTTSAFSVRVIADGGTIESLSCVTDAITALSGDEVSVLQDTSIAEQLDVQKATALKSTLAVTGAATLSSTLGVTGAATLSSTLGVTGAATLSSTLGVTGAATLSSTLGVTGATTLSSSLGVTGAATLSSTLGVTGATTLNNTLSVVGNATLTGDTDFEGSHTASIEDATHNDGSEYEVKNTDFIVFNKWDGADGQAYITLPAVASSEGRMIRFKSDDTITATTYVTLRPDSGDTSATIDGETTFDFKRPYDGLMVICHNNNWFIVQRKSK